MLAEKVDKSVSPENKENFHEFLRKQTDNFSDNALNTKDFTFKSLRSIMNNREIVVLLVIRIVAL